MNAPLHHLVPVSLETPRPNCYLVEQIMGGALSFFVERASSKSEAVTKNLVAEGRVVAHGVSDTAMLMAEEKVCADVETFGAFLNCVDGDCKPCAYFGPISTPDLVSQILLNPSATAEQLKAAATELRARYLEDQRVSVAQEYMTLQSDPDALPWHIADSIESQRMQIDHDWPLVAQMQGEGV